MELALDWFSVRCVFAVPTAAPASEGDSDDDAMTYEERVTLWRASGFDTAIALAEQEARDYADDVEALYLGLAQAYRLAEAPGHGSEVFSLMRDSDLDTEDYLDAFFDTGEERQGA
jgi:hypothetical protein